MSCLVRPGSVTIDYDVSGARDGFPVVFNHSLVWDRDNWAAQAAALAATGRWRCINIDTRNHGRSSTSAEPVTLADFCGDVLAVMDAEGAAKAAHVGLSMGGMIGMRLALAHSERVAALALFGTSADAEDPLRAPQYEAMAEMLGSYGPAGLVEPVMSIFFAERFRAEQPDAFAAYAEKFLAFSPNGAEAALLAVTRRDSVLDRLAEVRAPTLVVVGEEDVATPPAQSEAIARAVPGARLVRVAGSGHMVPVERPAEATQLLADFLAEALA
ncbi:MAG TPA: alpha/beta fold hydrolase [Myxococcota bacterium]|jgi:3-oxoadipate enol-lactonase|nr:alpha/beta fold hydrolase [Myxococcota bacterium]